VSERVVDLLEPVDVEDQDRNVGRVALRGEDRLLGAVEEEGPVRKARQAVVQREVAVLLGLAPQAPRRGRDEPEERRPEEEPSEYTTRSWPFQTLIRVTPADFSPVATSRSRLESSRGVRPRSSCAAETCGATTARAVSTADSRALASARERMLESRTWKRTPPRPSTAR